MISTKETHMSTRIGPSVLALLMLLPLAVPAQPSDTLPPLVSAEWLKKHSDDPDLVILHVAFSRRDYLREHIPGARFMWFSWLSPSTPEGSTEMAPVDDARRVLEDLRLTDRSRVVVYFTGSNLTTATRTIFAFRHSGLDGHVSLLDGGLEAWKRSGGPTTRETPSVSASTLTLTVRPDLIASADDVLHAIGDPSVTIIDARSKNFYEGTGGGTRPGHVKGAISLPYSSLVDSVNAFKSINELEHLFQEAGVRPGSTIVAYCHVGQQATVVLHAAWMLGFPVRLYDGSFEEWAALDEARYPVETASSAKP
jgi:thiosulfate/3-mercaptopyruvate sulfurtransferase